MRYVYTDPLLPGLEIVNHGTVEFVVLENNVQISRFTGYETGAEKVSEAFAERRASEYFEKIIAERCVEVPAVPPETLLYDSDADQIVAVLLED